MRILFFFCLSATLIAAPTPSGFARPPTADGPGVFWFWFDNAVTKKEITRQIQDIQSKGFSRVEIRSVKFNWRNDVDKEKEMRATGHKPLRYLSPEHIIHLRHALAEAKRLGMKVTLNTGMGWPPGGTWVDRKSVV